MSGRCTEATLSCTIFRNVTAIWYIIRADGLASIGDIPNFTIERSLMGAKDNHRGLSCC